MSADPDEAKPDKKLAAAMMWRDYYVRDMKAAGYSDDQIILALQNGLGRGPGGGKPAAMEGNIIARARAELGLKVQTLTDYKVARQRLGLEAKAGAIQAVGSVLPGRPGWTIDKDGNPVPNPHAGEAAAVTEWSVLVRNYQRRLAAGLVPEDELRAARGGGRAAWVALVRKYGDPNLEAPTSMPRTPLGAA